MNENNKYIRVDLLQSTTKWLGRIRIYDVSLGMRHKCLGGRGGLRKKGIIGQSH